MNGVNEWGQTPLVTDSIRFFHQAESVPNRDGKRYERYKMNANESPGGCSPPGLSYTILTKMMLLFLAAECYKGSDPLR